MTLSKADIDSLESLGICPVCGSELKVHSSLADGITEADSIHCIVCGESLECSDEEDAEVVEQADTEPSEVEVETLSDDEITAVMKKVLNGLESMGIELRS